MGQNDANIPPPPPPSKTPRSPSMSKRPVPPPPPPSKINAAATTTTNANANANAKQAAFDKLTGKSQSVQVHDIQRKRQQSRTVYVTKDLPETAKRYLNFSVYDDDKKQQYDEYIARMNKKKKKKKKKKRKKKNKTRQDRVISVSAPSSPVDDLNSPMTLTQSNSIEIYEEYEDEN